MRPFMPGPHQRGGFMPGNQTLQGSLPGGVSLPPWESQSDLGRRTVQTTPSSYDKTIPGYWSEADTSLSFVTEAQAAAMGNTTIFSAVYDWPGTEEGGYRALWSSPVFDTMPHLGPSPQAPDAIPLWVPGTSLIVQLRGLTALASTNALQVGYVEYTAPMATGELQPSCLKTDITPAALNVPGNTANASTTLSWTPGSATRYWKVVIVIDYYKATAPTSGLRLAAAAAQ